MPDHKSSRSSTASGNHTTAEHHRDGLASGQPEPNVKSDPTKPPDGGPKTRLPHDGRADRARPVGTPHGALHSVNGPLRGDEDPPKPPPPPPDAEPINRNLR